MARITIQQGHVAYTSRAIRLLTPMLVYKAHSFTNTRRHVGGHHHVPLHWVLKLKNLGFYLNSLEKNSMQMAHLQTFVC